MLSFHLIRWPWFLFILFGLILSGWESYALTKLNRYEYSQRHMGTLFRIVFYSPDSITAKLAAQGAFSRIAQLDQILSDYEPNSELNRLCRTAGTNKWVAVSPDLWRMLKKTTTISAKTEGAFDITVGPYVQLWRRSRRQHALPTPEALAQAKAAVGYQYIQLDKKQQAVKLLKPRMQLDMGAIGKGYAVDEAMQVLKSFGIRRALVDGGGNVAVSNPPPGLKGWAIEVEPIATGIKPRSLLLRHNAVATSGDLYQYVELNGVRYSHIVNPLTGLGLTDQSRVIIVAKTGTTTDWLSTAVSVLDPVKGIKLVRKVRGAKAYIYRQANGQVEQWQSEKE